MTCVESRTSPSAVGPCEGSGGTQETPAEDANEALLPGPFEALSGTNDIGAQLTTLIVKASREQKESARACRRSSEEAQRAADEKELQEMRDSADSKLAAGIVEGVATAAGGAIQIGTASTEKGRAVGAGAAGVCQGAGKAGALWASSDAARHDVAAKGAGQEADRAKRSVEDARDLEKDAKALLDRALDYYKEYLSAKADTQRATLLRA